MHFFLNVYGGAFLSIGFVVFFMGVFVLGVLECTFFLVGLFGFY
jgi:hypothetical protein